MNHNLTRLKGVFPINHSKSSFKSKTYNRLREKELSKAYRIKRQKRLEQKNPYPLTRFVLIKDFFRTPDLYKAIAYFLVLQCVITMITISSYTPTYAGALNLLSMITGATLIVLGVKEINKRQRLDVSRRKVQLSDVFQIICLMFITLFVTSFIYAQLHVKMPEQSNQTALTDLFSQFPVAMFLIIVIAAPIIEELVFRELLPFATGPSYLSFGLSSILFMVLHSPSGLMGWTSYLILAVGFLWARLRNNNVYAGIIVHITWNTISVIMGIMGKM